MEKMLPAAREAYNTFLEGQKHFRPEDRAIFIQEFLKRFCFLCGGMSGMCVCTPVSRFESALQQEES